MQAIIEVQLSEEEACCFAQFLKRVGYTDYRALAVSDEEAYAMQGAGERLRAALAAQGYAPR